MKNSKPFSLNLKDLWKGLITAILSGLTGGILTAAGTAIHTGAVDFKMTGVAIGGAAITGGIGYLQKNLFSNSNGEFLKSEPDSTYTGK